MNFQSTLFRQEMRTSLTFIIPVISKEVTDHWDLVHANLKRTLASVENQTNSNWRVLIVSQTKPELDYIEDKIIYIPALFQPAPKCPTSSKFSVDDVVLCRRMNELDRSRKIRVAAATLHEHKTDFVMVLEADDFISNRLCEFVEANREANGWCIEQGYIWNGTSNYMQQTNCLTSYTSSSWIVKVSYEMLPKEIPIDVDPTTLYLVPCDCPYLTYGHRKIREGMAEVGQPLQTLPFHGVIYHKGHGLNLSDQYSNVDRCLPPLRRMRRWSRKTLLNLKRRENRVRLTESIKSEFAICVDKAATVEAP